VLSQVGVVAITNEEVDLLSNTMLGDSSWPSFWVAILESPTDGSTKKIIDE
jgi:hypothetical protein